MADNPKGPAARAAAPFLLLFICSGALAGSLFDDFLQPHPYYALCLRPTEGTRIEAALNLDEWARNLDSPGALLLEDRRAGLKATHSLTRNLTLGASVFYLGKTRDYSKSHTIEDGYPFRLDMANALDESGFSIGAAYVYQNEHSLSVNISGVSGPNAKHLDATVGGVTRFRDVVPFISFRTDFPGLYADYSIHTQVSTNPFSYRTLFNRQTWLFGAGLFTPWQTR